MLEPGTSLGPYEIVAAIGAGGMGTVFRARDTRLGRDVALKFLPEGFSPDPDRIARFRREAQVLAWLNQPNIGAFTDSSNPAARRRSCSISWKARRSPVVRGEA